MDRALATSCATCILLLMTRRIVEISEWALPLKYAGYLLLIPLVSVAIDLALGWRADASPQHGLVAWAVVLMLASAIAEFCAWRLEQGLAIGFEVIGGLIFGSVGTTIAAIGLSAAEGAANKLFVLGFGGAFVGIGAFLILYVDRQFNRARPLGDDPDIDRVRRRLKPVVKRALFGLAGFIAMLFVLFDRADALFLTVMIFIVFAITLIIRAGLRH
ncbi:MAG: hypothetical protein AAF367_18005 [Pseudomonadota bacterium]